MQLSARILTALAVLAFVVGVAVGTKGATDDVSAATGTIDALNVGVCATTNADVFDLEDCGQLIKSDDPDYDAENPDARVRTAFFQQGPLGDLIEVDTLYGTYAHDPITGAESPRAIIEDGDLLRISISDSSRDRRDPVLIASEQEDFDQAFDAFATDKVGLRNETDDDTGTDGDQPHDAAAIVAEELGVDVDDLPALERHAEFAISDANLNSSTFSGSNSYEIIWGRRDADETDDFKPIASAEDNGQVKFFGPGDGCRWRPRSIPRYWGVRLSRRRRHFWRCRRTTVDDLERQCSRRGSIYGGTAAGLLRNQRHRIHRR